LKAAHHGHHHIQQDQVGPEGLHQRQGLFSVGGQRDFMAQGIQPEFQHLIDIRFVFSN
jgi:hypothetical protein